jgi:glycosyltransferase involved in cell wall biosynthesis
MNIGFDASRAFTKEATGTENYSFQLLREMLSIDTLNKYYVYTKIPREKIKFKFSQNVEVVFIDRPFLWTQIGLAGRTFQDPLDVLFVPAHTLPLIRRPGLPTVMTVHDLGAEYLPSSHQLKQQLYLKFITKYQLQTASHLIAVSEATKKDLMIKTKVKSKDVSVIYEGVNFSSQNPVSSEKTEQTLRKFTLNRHEYFLFVGTIQPRKNLIRLIESFSIFLIESQSADQNFKLVIAGKEGWDFKDILDLPRQLGIEKMVKFVGRVDDDELAALYKNALALTYPSLFEGFGLPILESYFFGKPVLTSNISSMPEIAGKGAILVNPTAVNDIMRAMQILYTDKEKRSDLVRHGKEQIKKFSWSEAAKATINVLERTVKDSQ